MARNSKVSDGHFPEQPIRKDHALHYRRLVDSLQEGFALAEIILDADGKPVDYRFLEVNPAFESITGVSAEDAIGRTVRELIPEVEERWIETYGRVALTGESVRFEADNKYLNKTLEAFAYSPEPGLFGHLFSDVTEKKRAQRDAEARKRILEAAVNQFPGVFTIYDSDRRILYTNDEVRLLSGLSAEEIVGRKDEDVFSRETWEQYLPVLERVSRSLVPEMVDVRFVERAEEVVQQIHFAPVLNVGGELQFVVGVAHDITEQKRKEELLRASKDAARQHLAEIEGIYQNAPVGLGVLDRNLRFVRINKRLADINGFSPDAHVGRTVREMLPALADKMEPGLQHVLDTGEPNLNLELTGETPGSPGVEHTWMESWFPIKNAEDRVVGVNMVVDKITDLKKVESDLVEMTKTLETRVEERTQSLENRTKQLRHLAVELIEAEERERKRLSEVLHEDLQQLLAAARLELHRTRRNVPESESLENANEFLGQAIQRARRLSHELSPGVLAHSGLIASLQWLIRQVGEQFGLAARLEFDGCDFEVSPFVKVFTFRSVQELLFNVVKHARVRSADVRLGCSGDNLVVSVADKGRGFDPGRLETSDGPMGLGLLGIRERTESIGGSFSVESMPGQGSRFALEVPLDFGREISKGDEAAINPGDSTGDGQGGTLDTEKIRLVIAEDHRIIRQGLVSVVSEQPDIVVVGEASNGREAVDIFQRTRPDVILMDVSMPIMDGVEATRQIRADDPKVRIIGLSMYDDDQVQRAMAAAGAETFVNKAETSGILLRAIYGISEDV
ncbi:MAG: PAS domain-containing protein [Spirochaetaceae bacterium]